MNEITNIIITPVRPTGKGLQAFCSLDFHNALSLNSIGVYRRLSGPGFRLVFPLTTLLNGKKINTFFPINKETGQQIEDAVSAQYEQLISKQYNPT